MHTLEQLLAHSGCAFVGEPVGVIYGGTSAERDISLKTGQALAQALREAGHAVTLYDFPEALRAFVSAPPRAVLIAMHSGMGENGTLQGFLETLQVPYSGSGVFATALAMDKVRAKAVLAAEGVAVAQSFAAYTPSEMTPDEVHAQMQRRGMGWPVVIKPSDSGSSQGVSLCKGPEDVPEALRRVLELFERGQATAMLTEQFMNGPEYTVGFFGDACLGSIHIKPAQEFYDYEAKYQSTSTQYIPVDGPLAQRLEALAAHAWRALGCRGVGRIDLMAHDDELFILEANTVPGMTATSLVPKLAASQGIAFPRFADLMLATATTDAAYHLERWRGPSRG